MAGSIVWTLGHQDTLGALGAWLDGAGRAGGLARRPGRGVELHRAALVRRASGAWRRSPGRLGLASALAMLAYVGGVLALRRLLALPTQQVAHAGV